jgi:hypothetical protein
LGFSERRRWKLLNHVWTILNGTICSDVPGTFWTNDVIKLTKLLSIFDTNSTLDATVDGITSFGWTCCSSWGNGSTLIPNKPSVGMLVWCWNALNKDDEFVVDWSSKKEKNEVYFWENRSMIKPLILLILKIALGFVFVIFPR